MKKCTQCLESKNLDEFSWRNKSKGTKQSLCKTCAKSRDARLYKQGKKSGATIEQSRAIRARNRAWLRQYLESNPCVDCGEKDIRVLEFDHLPQFVKTANVSELASSSLARIQAEIAKCEVVCANCHKRRTYGRLDNCFRL
jgi:hypothetical protein